MVNFFNQRSTPFKTATIIVLVIGGIYTVMGSLMYLMVQFQQFVFHHLDKDVPDEFFLLHEVVEVYMPFLIVLGLGYLAFGNWLRELKGKALYVNIVLAFAGIAWAIPYTISAVENTLVFRVIPANELGFLDYFFRALNVLAVLAIIAAFTIPQFIAGKKIKEGLKGQ